MVLVVPSSVMGKTVQLVWSIIFFYDYGVQASSCAHIFLFFSFLGIDNDEEYKKKKGAVKSANNASSFQIDGRRALWFPRRTDAHFIVKRRGETKNTTLLPTELSLLPLFFVDQPFRFFALSGVWYNG